MWKKLIVKIGLISVSVSLLLFTAVVAIVYAKQDAIVSELIQTANADFSGTVKITDSHIAPFANFPHIAIDLEEIEIYETKNTKEKPILHFNDAFIGFNIWNLIAGKMDVNSIRLRDGKINVIQFKDGSTNLLNALSTGKTEEEMEEDFHFDLKKIRLDNIQIEKYNETSHTRVATHIKKAKAKVKTDDSGLHFDLASKFKLTVQQNKTLLKNKNIQVNTTIHLNQASSVLSIDETEIGIENASFGFNGKINLKNEMDVDLFFHGEKSNFDLLLALAPDELIPTLRKFDNKGSIFFKATVKGKSINGKQPAIDATFGCKNGFFNNLETHKKLDKIGFSGSFTNGEQRNALTSKFVLSNFSAKPEAGVFTGKLIVENFESPEINMQLKSDFDLDFLAKFLTYRELKGLSGRVALTMNFHDIIDFEQPEKSIEKLNESYFTQLEVENLKFKGDFFHLPLDDLDIRATMTGHVAKIEKMHLKVGESDLKISGKISDLPAIMHQSNLPVESELSVQSNFINLAEITQFDGKNGFNEQLKNLRMKLQFKCAGNALSESPNLPKGEFILTDFYAKFKNYPHVLHDFHADVLIEKDDFKVIDFSGLLDQSDFHFNGKLKNYNLWFDENKVGDTQIEFDLTSRLLQLKDLFSYGGENYVPEDYRNEEITNMKIHGVTTLHFLKNLHSTDLELTQLEGKMKIHPMKLEQFKGKIHLQDNQLSIHNFQGKLGNTSFTLASDYYLGKGKNKKKNWISITSPQIDFDQLFAYEQKTSNTTTTPTDHDAVFSLYDFDFPDLEIRMDIQKLNYHHYLLKHVKAKLRAETNHMVHVDKLNFDVSGGHFDMKGYLSGKDKKNIYFHPTIEVKNLNLDKVMVKFDNFGQDYLVSENVKGNFSGKITGKIHLHADLVPKLDDSELKIDMQIIGGKLLNFAPMLALNGYFQEEKLANIHFDTLTNSLSLKKGEMEIPKMTINSNLGFLEISGKQQLQSAMEMNYHIGIPWKMISQVGAKKLFSRKTNSNESIEEIQYKQKNSKFIYLQVKGDLDKLDISLSRKNKNDKA